MGVEVMQALNIMWMGMAGIFVAILIIMVCVLIMQKVIGKDKEENLES